MASRSRPSSRSNRDSDSMEVLKPLVVLALFGTILYGAYAVVQKGPSTSGDAPPAVAEAPPFVPPAVEMKAAVPVAPSAQVAAAVPAMPASPPALPVGPAVPAIAAPTVGTAAPATVVATAPAPAMPPTVPAGAPLPAPVPPPPSGQPAAPVAITAAAAATGAAVGAAAVASSQPTPGAPTYLTAESAPPPAQESLATLAPSTAPAERPDRYATLSTTPPAAAFPPPAGSPPPPSAATGSSAAFATAWADAHEKLAAGRYAEALAALSIWYDDPSLGLEESQRLEDLLGQLAGTVIYSQQDLLLPPHVVAAGESLSTVALPRGISWQLLGKINGIASPQDLVPGEHLKVIQGPFDAVVSVSRRRLSLQLGGNYAGSFPVVVGRQFLARVGGSIPVAEIRRGAVRDVQSLIGPTSEPAAKPSIVLADGLVIEAAEDPGMASDSSPATSLVVSVRDLAELLDILGPGSKVLIRQ